MYPGPPSWRPDRKSRGDRMLGSIVALGVILVAVVVAAVLLSQFGGLEGVLSNFGLLPGQ